jgi:uncharacterized membrane protein required for colicin V production
MNSSWLDINWFDFLLVVVLMAGVYRGRKRGMSVEFSTMLQWLIIVFAGAFLYAPAAALMADVTFLGMLLSNIVSYLGIAVGVKCGFLLSNKYFGNKLAGSDAFGKAEYYFGMVSGMIRFFCVMLVVLSVLNARLISNAESSHLAEVQQENFGDISFPTLHTIQQEIFRESVTGRLIKNHMSFLLLEPTKPKVFEKIERREFTY